MVMNSQRSAKTDKVWTWRDFFSDGETPPQAVLGRFERAQETLLQFRAAHAAFHSNRRA